MMDSSENQISQSMMVAGHENGHANLALFDTNVYKNNVVNNTTMPTMQVQDASEGVNSFQKKSQIKLNTISMDSSLATESLTQELRQKKSMASQELRGITKMGGFRRPASSSFYQVKRHSINKNFSKSKSKNVNADLPASYKQSPIRSSQVIQRRLTNDAGTSCGESNMAQPPSRRQNNFVVAQQFDEDDREA